jgi:hypothetical protein
MNEVLIKLVGFVGGHHPLLGQYVVTFDPAIRRDGTILLQTTGDPKKATVYADNGAAWELWLAVSPNQPVRRYDGKPNRPMTAFTVKMVPLERALRPPRRLDA